MQPKEFEIEAMRIRPHLFREALRWLEDADEAEDIVQDVLLKLWSMKENLETYDSVEALAVVMAKRLSLNRLRNRRKLTCEEEMPDKGDYDTPEHRYISQEEESKIEKLILSLPDTQQTILRMKHIDGLETSEIARLIGCKESTVRSNLMRARKKILTYFIK